MIQSNIQLAVPKAQPPRFPRLVISKHKRDSNQRFVVLFTEPQKGTVVWREENAAWKVGDQFDKFISCVDFTEEWEDFNGVVTLENA